MWIREVRGGALGANPTVLSFDGHEISAKSRPELHKVVCEIARNTCTDVYLGNNTFGDVGAQAIAVALKENKTLTSLE